MEGMIVYAICSDGSRTEIGRLLDGLETVTALPELEEMPADDQRKMCPDIDFTISTLSEIDREAMRQAYAITEKLMAIARALARRASISVEEAVFAIERLIAVSNGCTESLCELCEEKAEDNYISEHRAESMEPRPVIVVFPTLETLCRRTLRDLYGQGVDTGPLGLPSGAEPPR